jgi:hypothetical protein
MTKKVFLIGAGAVFFIPFFLAGIYVMKLGVNDIRLGLAAVSWPTVAAHLESCEVTSHRSSKSTVFRADVKYTYTVAGVPYTGDQLAVDYWSTGKEETHAAHCRNVKSMTPFVVRYSPDHPDMAVIIPPEHPWISGKFFFGLAWLTIATAVASGFLFVGLRGRAA